MAIDREKLKKEHIFTGQGTATELSAEMDRVAAIEKEFKTRVSVLRWSALGVFLFFLALTLVAGVFAFLFGLILSIGLLVYSGKVQSGAVVHDRVEFLRLLLKTLSYDTHPDTSFHVLLRLCPLREKLSEKPNPHDQSGKERLFKDAWFSFSGRLSDGTSISESCIDFIRQRSRKNPRGKIKTKERPACLLRMNLSYKPATYGDVTTVAGPPEQIFRLPAGTQMKAFIPSNKAITMKTLVRANVNAAGLHAATEAVLLGAYRILNVARKRKLAVGGAR